jgi:hypothetical protein
VLAGWGEAMVEGGAEGWGAGAAWGALFGDVLARRLILRFVLARAALGLHRAHGRDASLQPTCFPPLLEARARRRHIARARARAPGMRGRRQGRGGGRTGGGCTGWALEFGSKPHAAAPAAMCSCAGTLATPLYGGTRMWGC